MPLTERAREFETLVGLLDESARGHGTLMLVTGPVATGKTTICRLLSDAAVERGHRVLTATATGPGQASTHGVIDQLLLAAGLLPRADPGAADDARVVTDLLAVADESPLLIVVDSVHHADTDSLRSLLHCVSRIRHRRVALLLNEVGGALHGRDEEQVALRVALRRHPECHRLRLRPLSEAGVGELLAAALDDPSEELVRRCYDLTGGNPLLVRSLVEDNPAGAGPLDDLAAGEAFRDNVQACLHSGPAELLAAARALATVRGHGSVELVAELGELEPEIVTAALAHLDASGLTENARFRHPATAEVVLGDVDRGTRRELRRRAARFLMDRGAPAGEVAPLLRGSGITAPWVVPVLSDAAERARVDGDVDTAVDHLNRAHAASDDERQRNRLRMRLLRIHWEHDPSGAVHHLGEMHRAAEDDTVASEDVAALVRYLAWHGHLAEVGVLLEAVDRGRYDPAPPDLDDVRDWLECTFPAAGLPGPGEEPASGSSSGRLLREVLREGSSDARVRRATRILHGNCRARRPDPDAFVQSAGALLYCGEIELARAACTEFLERDDVAHHTFLLARVRAVLAEAAVRAGDMDTAATLARRALDAVPVAAWGRMVAFPRSSLLRAATALDDRATAEEVLHQHGPDGPATNRIELLFRHARGHHLLATGRAAEAAGEFRSCGEQMLEWECDRPGFVPWRSALAEAHLETGNVDDARALAQQQLQLLTRPGTPLHEHTCLVLARARDHGGRGGHTVTSAIAPPPAPADPATDEHDSRWAEPRPLRARQGRGVAELSDAELRVASLAALGSTNREIARQLFITVSTVEQHLTRIYRKLAVRRRRDLPADLLDTATSPVTRPGF